MSRFLSLLFVLTTTAIRTGASLVPGWVDCSYEEPSSDPSKNTTKNNVFQDNLLALLNDLPSSAMHTGFASLSTGNGTDRAFARGLCLAHALGDCQTCLISAASSVYWNCNGSRRAAVWHEKCVITYADTNASTVFEEAYRHDIYNTPVVPDKDAFGRTYTALMSRLVARVVNASSEMFVTGEAVYDRQAPTPNGTMYGLVQCMKDRSAAECGRCLQASVPRLPGCCYGHEGGVVLAYNCYLRVQIYTYYDLMLDAPPAPEPASPSPLSFIPVTTGERKGKKGANAILAVVLPVGTAVFVVGILVAVFLYKRKVTPTEDCSSKEDISYLEQKQINLPLLREATNNFSEENKLGSGGFGEVFKGILQTEEVIAVKRLSKHSSQGFHELKNELVLAAKLKHKNLAPLIGVCLQKEMLLVYEYMPNRSLDTFLFDPAKRQLLDWHKRFMIICGIARGLRYLHEESHLMVIHRDLKPSNVLLDADLNPKISDFGLARAFKGDQSRDVTGRPAGTLGYMSPEYAYSGHVSTKSDMFSFGVIVLEMVTGRKSNSNYECQDSTSLLSYVWRKWKTGSAVDVVDALLGTRGQYPESEVLNCLEVGLLCVQENPTERPDASTVVLLLGGSNIVPDEARREPSRPAFLSSDEMGSLDAAAVGTTTAPMVRDGQSPMVPSSENGMTISDFLPR